ncbi:hypothetical protein EVAR_100836_1 [Eumeta japonica]|uniref:Uncharacterized protein n=1 Tax=Eumeta variegata TaxID=151549 RepID=A0A4C1SZJ2_EUMVA|nr:hypothetical protein EVAR_100836_1 [Eumeta japonica]
MGYFCLRAGPGSWKRRPFGGRTSRDFPISASTSPCVFFHPSPDGVTYSFTAFINVIPHNIRIRGHRNTNTRLYTTKGIPSVSLLSVRQRHCQFH